MLSLIRDPAGEALPADESIVGPEGELTMPGAGDFQVKPAGVRHALTTGVIYWEGEAVVEGTHGDEPIEGLAYVELTGYAPYEPLDLGTPPATPEL